MRAVYDRVIKRFFDILLSAFLLVLLSPLLLFICVLVRLICGKPVLFEQERPGKDCKTFTIKKFRSMADLYDENGELLPDEQRLSSFGIKLRAWSLDELPELWNIFKGDMSFVGPRPLLCRYVELYSQRQKRRHEVRPGLTGLAQVNGRNLLSWEDKYEYDVWYVEHESLWLDISIVLKTVKNVLKREGINSNNSATMEAFSGSSPEDEIKAKEKIGSWEKTK